jgi:hypothetical protein
MWQRNSQPASQMYIIAGMPEVTLQQMHLVVAVSLSGRIRTDAQKDGLSLISDHPEDVLHAKHAMGHRHIRPGCQQQGSDARLARHRE